jgi:hypothetical protein
MSSTVSVPPKRQRSASKATPSHTGNPSEVRNNTDPGDATSRNYRYQWAYGVILLVAAKRGDKPYIALWCEHHEDFLAQRGDEVYDAYQIKTSRPELGPWKMTDSEMTKSIRRFVDFVAEFGDRIGNLYFVSNTEFDVVTPENKDEKRRGRCPLLFLQHVHSCSTRADIAAPFGDVFDALQEACGCDADQLLTVLRRMNIIVGPSRGEIDATLSNEHIGRLDGCQNLNAGQLDAFRDDLVARVCRASTLQVTDPIRHLRPLVDAQDYDPVLAAKRIVVAEDVVYRQPASRPAEDKPLPPISDAAPLKWDNHLGHTYCASNDGRIFTHAIQIGAKNCSVREVQLEDAYIISGETGARVAMTVGIAGDGWVSPSETNPIPPSGRLILRAEFNPPNGLAAQDFYSIWKEMQLVSKYDGLEHRKIINEAMVSALYANFPLPQLGPRVTRKAG